MAELIPVCEPTLGPLEQEYVRDAMESGWIGSVGKYIGQFETGFAEKVGAKYGISVCNGTAAVHIALLAAGLKPGQEVIMPSFTMVATANAVSYCNAKPIFVDSVSDSWTMDTSQIESLINDKTFGILSVTIYGHPSDYKVIAELRDKYKIMWIEDAAEGHGALAYEKRLAEQPDATAYSFFANKILTTGEGGMVCTNNPDISDSAKYYKNLAFPLDGQRNYVHQAIGYNYRMTNLQAAIGYAQTARFDELVTARRRNAAEYLQEIRKHNLGELLGLPVERDWAKNCYWMFGVTLNDHVKNSRENIMQQLRAEGVDSRPFFFPMHKQPIYATRQTLPVSEYLAERGLYLPSSSHLSSGQIQKVVKALSKILHP